MAGKLNDLAIERERTVKEGLDAGHSLATDEPGTKLSNLEYAPLAEIMGRLFWAPEVFNCQAPDVPNMIALIRDTARRYAAG